MKLPTRGVLAHIENASVFVWNPIVSRGILHSLTLTPSHSLGKFGVFYGSTRIKSWWRYSTYLVITYERQRVCGQRTYCQEIVYLQNSYFSVSKTIWEISYACGLKNSDQIT